MPRRRGRRVRAHRAQGWRHRVLRGELTGAGARPRMEAGSLPVMARRPAKRPPSPPAAPPTAPAPPSLYAGASPLPFDAALAVAHLHARDRVLSRLITRVGPFRLQTEATQPPFQSLTESILHQQVTGKAAAAILGRFRAAFGSASAFPAPERVVVASDEELRAVGISRSKAAALRDLAAKTLDGTVPGSDALHGMDRGGDRRAPDGGAGHRGLDRPHAAHVPARAAGRAPGRGLRRPQGLREDLPHQGRAPTPAEITKRGERWRPYRTVASWYLWRALEVK